MLETEERMEGHGDAISGAEAAFFEVTIASVDQPKLLSRLSEALVRHTAAQLAPGTGRANLSRANHARTVCLADLQMRPCIHTGSMCCTASCMCSCAWHAFEW